MCSHRTSTPQLTSFSRALASAPSNRIPIATCSFPALNRTMRSCFDPISSPAADGPRLTMHGMRQVAGTRFSKLFPWRQDSEQTTNTRFFNNAGGLNAATKLILTLALSLNVDNPAEISSPLVWCTYTHAEFQSSRRSWRLGPYRRR